MDNKWILIIIIVVIICIVGIWAFANHRETNKQNFINEYIPNEVNDNSNNINMPEENLDVNRSEKDVTIEVLTDTVTRKSAEILITDKNETPFFWGESFRVQKKDNGDWKDLKYIVDDLIAIGIMHKLDENNQLKMKLDYGKYYGTLKKGVYRIVKTVYNNKEINLYSNEFEIK